MATGTCSFLRMLFGLGCLLGVIGLAHATPATDWLQVQSQPNGSYRSGTPLATDLQATSETLLALEARDLGDAPDAVLGRDYLTSRSNTVTEEFARRIRLEHSLGNDVQPLIDQLQDHQNRDGGFGDRPGYTSTVLDTAWALETLSTVDASAPDSILRAVGFLLDRQAVDGSWSAPGSAGAHYTTALALRALARVRDRFDLATTLDAARDHLLDARDGSGAIGTPHESAAAVLAIAPTAASKDVYADVVASLRDRQRPDGSWNGSVFATALAVQALAFAEQPQPNPRLGSITLRLADGETGQGLDGVTVTLGGGREETAVTDAAGEVAFTGLSAGDYALDAAPDEYSPLQTETTLAAGQNKALGTIRLLRRADATSASIQGTITDAATGAAIAGATVTVSGTANAGTTTDTEGRFLLDRLATGGVTVVIEASGYRSKSLALNLQAGTTHLLTRALQPATGVTFSGTVTTRVDGTPVAGVDVAVTGAATASGTTATDGGYRLAGLPAGSLTITVSQPGFEPASANVDVRDGQEIVFSPSLIAQGETETPPDTGAVRGTVIEAGNDAPVADATVDLAVDVSNQTVNTDDAGQFTITDAAAGNAVLSVSADGYRGQSLAFDTTAGITLDLGEIVLTPRTVDAAAATGVLVDSVTNEPLAGRTIEADFEGDVQSVVSVGDGTFSFDAPAEIEGTLTAAPEGYLSTTRPLILQPGDNDLGQVRVRPQDIDDLLPDLSVRCLQANDARTGSDPLAYDDVISAEVKNLGVVSTRDSFTVSAFVDLDQDRTPGTDDIILGEVVESESIRNGQSVTVSVPVIGGVPFRDAPITIRVDSRRTIAESDENNNSNLLPSRCPHESVDFADLEISEKWHWSGWSGDSSMKHVQGPLIVAQLSDDNADGLINSADTPDLVFGAGNHPWAAGRSVLVAVDGETGSEIWSRRSVEPTQRGPTAVGDIDDDGMVEIVVVNLDGTELIALEHDGTEKWRTPTETSDRNIEGGAAIANIDGIGAPEIVFARSVYNADGSLRWRGTGDRAEQKFGPLSIVADLDLDGTQEVIAGRTVYRSDGSIMWTHESSRDGFNAVGNFDKDDFAEVVIVSPGSNKVYLVDTDGTTIWGPVDMPGSGGGPPTIADVDSDGQPEIGIATSRYFLVLETDGSLKWDYRINDGSARTGSTMFDLNDDGRPELLQNDHNKLRIFDGPTGEVVSSIDNDNTTTIDYPIIADIDGDLAAEIAVGSSWKGSRNGVRVFEPSQGHWAPTRSQWNQHSYHITNINSDGSIPQNEEPSWIEHNTYRLNRFIENEPFARTDISVSLARVVDNGSSSELSVTARIGNSGSRAFDGPIEIAFFDGDPVNGGMILGTRNAPSLNPGQWAEIVLGGVNPQQLSGSRIFAVADPAGSLVEYREDNNVDDATIEVASIHGATTISSDRGSYGPGTPVPVSAAGTNTGTFPGDFRIALHVEDTAGDEVTDLGETDLGTLASGHTGNATATWSADRIAPGFYEIVSTLHGSDGSVADQARTSVVLQSTEGDQPAATMRTTTGRVLYSPDDTVEITHLARNVSPNALLADAELTTVVIDPDGLERSRTSTLLGDLAAGAQRERLSSHVLTGAPEGTWTVRGVLTDGQDTVLAQDEAHFDVATGLLDQLSGTVTPQHAQRYVGQPQTCTDTLVNEGEAAAIEIRRLVLDRERARRLQSTSDSLSLGAGETRILDRTVSTGSFEPGLHTCLLQVRVDGEWANLDSADFQLAPPPIDIEGTLEAGDRGRLLVLLDPAVKAGQKAEDPHGPKNSPAPSDQRTWLEARLDEAGWSYTIATDGEAFATELRSDGYAAVALFNEQVKIAEADQHYLTDTVAQDGVGLFVSGMHDRRNGRVEPALGLKSKGKLPHVDGLYVYDSEIATADAFDFAMDDKPLRLDLQGARRLADYTAEQKGNGKGKGKGGKQPGPGLTVYRHGNGHSIDAGFDLLLQGTVAGGENRYSELLLAALEHVHPDDPAPRAGRVWPLHLDLVNEGLATPGRVVLDLPAGMAVIDPGRATATNGRLTWPFTLAIDEAIEREAWVRLPDQPGPVTLEALIQTGSEPDRVDHRTVTYTIDTD